MENLDDLEYRLRNLLREWGSDVARMAFEHATATLHIAERNRIEARIFGDVPVSSAAGAGSLAAPSVLSGNGHGQHSQLISNDDIYQQYEAGVKHLLHLIDREHQHYYDLLIYQQRLHENLSRARRYGHDPTLRAERAEILAYLNEMAIAIAGYSFQEVHQRLATSDTSNHGVSLQLVQGFFGTGGIPNGKALIDSYLEVLIERYGAVRFGRLLAASASEPRGTERAGPGAAAGVCLTHHWQRYTG
ncbi:MAG: hypothetical protein HC837_13650 [Chloroflexaceae bacterium]|nr:hypothetical protein [Chloroflexaceae bacterium]